MNQAAFVSIVQGLGEIQADPAKAFFEGQLFENLKRRSGRQRAGRTQVGDDMGQIAVSGRQIRELVKQHIQRDAAKIRHAEDP